MRYEVPHNCLLLFYRRTDAKECLHAGLRQVVRKPLSAANCAFNLRAHYLRVEGGHEKLSIKDVFKVNAKDFVRKHRSGEPLARDMSTSPGRISNSGMGSSIS